MMKDEFLSRLQGNAHRRVSPKSDDTNAQFATQLSLVAFGDREAVRKIDGVLPRPFAFDISLKNSNFPVSKQGHRLASQFLVQLFPQLLDRLENVCDHASQDNLLWL